VSEVLATIELEPDTILVVECHAPMRGMTWVECPSADSAYAASWQLRRDAATMGTKIRIINVVSGQVVLNELL
jgi:hypothetical protein